MAVSTYTNGDMWEEIQSRSLTLFCAAITVFLLIPYIIGLGRSLTSPLNKLPGPWYAPLTTLHLRYAFARGTIWKMVERNHKIYGPVVRLGPRQIWISEKAAMRSILQNIDLPKVQMYAEISRDPLSPGLFGEVRHDPHKRLKRFLSPAFTVGYVDNLETYFAHCVGALVNRYTVLISQGDRPSPAVTDMMVDLHNVALDIMGECSFGMGFGQTNPRKDEYLNVEERVWNRMPHSIFSGMRQRYQRVYVKRFLRKLGVRLQFDWPADMIMAIKAIAEARMSQQSERRADLLQHLVDNGSRPDTDHKMTARDIMDQMSEILLAGSETTSGTIACVFLELIRSPEKKAKLLASLPVLSPDDPIINSKTIREDPQFRYLNYCIQEGLRMHPIASEMGRKTAEQSYELSGYYIPPGTVVSASYRDLHRNREFWPEPLKFWPERWGENEREREGAPQPDLEAYYPFSSGKHACVGKNFAWAEMRMVVANMFSRFDFEELPEQEIDYRQYITMQFKTGSWKVKVIPRYAS